MSSRLFLAVREELGLAYYIHSFYHPYSDTGYFAVAAGVDKQRIDLAIDQIFIELKKIAKEGVTAAELKKAQEYIIGHLVLELEHSDEIAYLFGIRWLLYGRVHDIETIKAEIKKVTVADVNRLARKLFTDQALVLTVVGPKTLSDKIKKSYKLNTKEWKER
jgi:predicted Zn-dependent peptidase